MSSSSQHKGRRGTVATLVTVVLLVVLVFWIASTIAAHNSLQDCLDSGRRTCRTVPSDGD